MLAVALNKGDNVTVYNHVTKFWEPGKIIDRHVAPRSYIVQDGLGNTVRRNRQDLKPSENEFKPRFDNNVDLLNEHLNDSQVQSYNSPRNNFKTPCPVSSYNPDSQTSVKCESTASPEKNKCSTPPKTNDVMVKTRSGRCVIKPNRLNL